MGRHRVPDHLKKVVRSISFDRAVFDAILALADEREEDLSKIANEALAAYAKKNLKGVS